MNALTRTVDDGRRADAAMARYPGRDREAIADVYLRVERALATPAPATTRIAKAPYALGSS